MPEGLGDRCRRIAGSEPFLVLGLSLAVLLVHLATDAVSSLDRRLLDLAVAAGPAAASDRVALIAIDEASIARVGPWPWRREVHAALLDRLATGRPQAVVEAFPLAVPQDEQGLAALRQLREEMSRGPQPVPPEWAARLSQAEQALDMDGRLAHSLAAAGNVLLGARLDVGDAPGRPPPLPAWAARSAVPGGGDAGQQVAGGRLPAPQLGAAAAGVGHLNLQPDADGNVRGLPMLLDWGNQAVPSVALLASARGLGTSPAEIRVRHGQALQVGPLRVPIDDAGNTLLRFHARRALVADRFSDVLEGRLAPGRYQGKLVFIGPTAASVVPLLPVPGGASAAPVELLAQGGAALLAGQAVAQPAWGTPASLLLAVSAAACLALLWPRIPPRLGTALALGTAAALLLAEFLAAGFGGVWLQLAPAALVILVGQSALSARCSLVSLGAKLRSADDSDETNRLMGLALQSQGQLDEAFDRLRRVPLGDLVKENLYNLGLDFERRRQFAKALSVYETIAARDPAWRDLAERLPRARTLAEVVTLAPGTSHVGGGLLLGAQGVEQPMLGRYRVEKELGKGAMGIVYQGRDPKIGRIVAIKTMTLSQDFGEASATEARERFFLEAEIAGRLQHPDIVTIYDAGEEYELAYIAMEFLKGKDLVAHCRAPNLLPVATVLHIIARVADALEHAHQQGVVHRDIKPANIMYDASADTVKVTDFGIARVTDSNKTRTGMVMGTPSFMSPEQVAGQKVDGRSDIYSLGVMMFQMLGGALPFRGDTMAELIYKISNEPPPDLSTLRKGLPEGVAAVAARAMAKRADDRYASGREFAAALRDVMAAAGLVAPTAAPSANPQSPAATEEPGVFERTHPGLAAAS